MEATNSAKIHRWTTAIFLIKERPRLHWETAALNNLYFVIFGFLAFFLITYVANICRWLFCIFIFILASKQAKCDNREQEAAIREKRKKDKKIHEENVQVESFQW